MAQLSLYYQTQLETKVSLLAKQVNADMDRHLLDNLRDKIEKKVIDNGIVMRINRLIDYDYGVIDKSNFMGTTVYNVKYECFICSPTKNLEIVCVVDNIIRGYLIGRNGPVIIAISTNNIDTQKFSINGDTIINIKTKNAIQKGDYLKVSIINVNINLGELHIVVLCKLLNMATKDEIANFKEDQTIPDANVEETREFI